MHELIAEVIAEMRGAELDYFADKLEAALRLTESGPQSDSLPPPPPTVPPPRLIKEDAPWREAKPPAP